MTATITRTEPVYWGVVTSPDEADRQVYADYGDGSYISTHAEQMATREYLRLVTLGVRCGIWRGPALVTGEDMIFADKPEDEEPEVPAVEHKTRTFPFAPGREVKMSKRGMAAIHDKSAMAVCTCGWKVVWDNRDLARSAARAHREEAA